MDLRDLKSWLQGPAGWLTVAPVLVAAVLSLFVLVGAARSTGRRRTGARAVAAVGGLAGGVAAAAWMLVRARRLLIALPLGLAEPLPPNQKVDFRWHLAFWNTENFLLSVGIGLAWCASLLALSALVAAARPGGLLRDAPRRTVLLVSVAALVVTTGIGLIRRASAGGTWRRSNAFPSPTHLDGFVAAVEAPIAEARTHLLIVTVLGLAAAVLVSRSRASDSERPLGGLAAVASAAVFFLGVAAFVATRGMAHDARYPIPVDGIDHLDCPASGLDPRSLPSATRGDPFPRDAWTLELHPRGAVVEVRSKRVELQAGEAVVRSSFSSEVTTLDQFEVDLRRVREVQPRLLVVAPALLPTTEAAPWLGAIERIAGDRFAMVVVEPERRFSTRTLGELPERPRCSVMPVTFDPDGTPLSTHRTWGDLARETAAAKPPRAIRVR